LLYQLFQKSAYYIDVEHGAAFRVSLASEGSKDFDIVSIAYNYNKITPQNQ
jgi:hypothetical protein